MYTPSLSYLYHQKVEYIWVFSSLPFVPGISLLAVKEFNLDRYPKSLQRLEWPGCLLKWAIALFSCASIRVGDLALAATTTISLCAQWVGRCSEFRASWLEQSCYSSERFFSVGIHGMSLYTEQPWWVRMQGPKDRLPLFLASNQGLDELYLGILDKQLWEGISGSPRKTEAHFGANFACWREYHPEHFRSWSHKTYPVPTLPPTSTTSNVLSGISHRC